MAGKEKVAIQRSDQFQEVDEELTRAMADLDDTIGRVSAIFDGDEDEEEDDVAPAEKVTVEKKTAIPPASDERSVKSEDSPPKDDIAEPGNA
jgi:hypothetical protein